MRIFLVFILMFYVLVACEQDNEYLCVLDIRHSRWETIYGDGLYSFHFIDGSNCVVLQTVNDEQTECTLSYKKDRGLYYLYGNNFILKCDTLIGRTINDGESLDKYDNVLILYNTFYQECISLRRIYPIISE
ncbi:hypothetical protein KSZ12_13540 [Parabacteroides distasonis]|uniref:hypothetical protein n=1 Tax=Parabacteroides distasonis TaxID=823 RepID=UPI001C3883CB|nr:hypothetical protein [Parabacteroides distasonis]MBV4226861.1 hypothetical protein [Parabacteroides distasonis]